MTAFLIVIVLFALPFIFLAFSQKLVAILMGIYVVMCLPSIIYMTYSSIKTRSWPKIIAGPGFIWPGGRYTSPDER